MVLDRFAETIMELLNWFSMHPELLPEILEKPKKLGREFQDSGRRNGN